MTGLFFRCAAIILRQCTHKILPSGRGYGGRLHHHFGVVGRHLEYDVAMGLGLLELIEPVNAILVESNSRERDVGDGCRLAANGIKDTCPFSNIVCPWYDIVCMLSV